PVHYRSGGIAARAFLLRRVGCDAGIFRATRTFPRCGAKPVSATRESDVVLARVFAVHRLAALCAGELWVAANRRGGRRRQRACSTVLERKRHTAERLAARRKRIRH